MAEANEVLVIASLVQQAQQAVEAVEDPQMKLMAFGEILKFLLAHKHEPAEIMTKTKVVKAAPASKAEPSTKSRGTKGRLEELIEEGFFSKPRNVAEVLSGLEEHGHHLRQSDLTWYLQELTRGKTLRRKKMEPEGGGKQIWHYSNW